MAKSKSSKQNKPSKPTRPAGVNPVVGGPGNVVVDGDTTYEALIPFVVKRTIKDKPAGQQNRVMAASDLSALRKAIEVFTVPPAVKAVAPEPEKQEKRPMQNDKPSPAVIPEPEAPSEVAASLVNGDANVSENKEVAASPFNGDANVSEDIPVDHDDATTNEEWNQDYKK